MLGLDQTRFIIRLPKVNTQTLIDLNTLDAMTYTAVREHIQICTQDFKAGAKHWKTKKGAMTKSVYPLDGGSALTIALGWSTQGKYHFMTVQFNQSRLTTMGAIDLCGTFACMFDWGYAEFFERAECSYIEIPLDVVGANIKDYLFFDTGLKSYNDYHEEDGTLYLGSRLSGRYITVYDKAKEIADKGGSVSKGHWLRIEPRSKPHVPASAMAALPNAFATLRVIDKKKLLAIKHNISVNVFREQVFMQGMQPQAAFLIALDRKELLAGLQAAAPDWYDPVAVWKMFPAAAHRITPAGMHALSNLPAGAALFSSWPAPSPSTASELVSV